MSMHRNSHVIGMIHQHEAYLRTLNGHSPKTGERIIPLLSVSQNIVSMMVAQYDHAYYEFLLAGDFEREPPFLKVKEYGAWDLGEGVDARISAAMILAMMDALEDMWIVDDRSERAST